MIIRFLGLKILKDNYITKVVKKHSIFNRLSNKKGFIYQNVV